MKSIAVDLLGSFAVLFDKLSRKIGKVNPSSNLSILIDSYVELYMFLILILGSAHVKFEVCTGSKRPKCLDPVHNMMNNNGIFHNNFNN